MLVNDQLSYHPGGIISTLHVLSHIPGFNKETSLLDIGCGNGSTIGLLKKLGVRNVTAMDRNPGVVRHIAGKYPDIPVFSSWDSLLNEAGPINVILLESVLSFNNDEECKNLGTSLLHLKETKGLKFIGLVDYYAVDPLPEDFTLAMARVFGIKKIRDKNMVLEWIYSLKKKDAIQYWEECTFRVDLKEKYVKDQQFNKLLADPWFQDWALREPKARELLGTFIDEMTGLFKRFEDHLMRFECVIAL